MSGIFPPKHDKSASGSSIQKQSTTVDPNAQTEQLPKEGDITPAGASQPAAIEPTETEPVGSANAPDFAQPTEQLPEPSNTFPGPTDMNPEPAPSDVSPEPSDTAPDMSDIPDPDGIDSIAGDL